MHRSRALDALMCAGGSCSPPAQDVDSASIGGIDVFEHFLVPDPVANLACASNAQDAARLQSHVQGASSRIRLSCRPRTPRRGSTDHRYGRTLPNDRENG